MTLNSQLSPADFFSPVTASNWADLEKLFVHHGNPNYCWCTWWRLSSVDYSRLVSSQRKACLKSFVDSGTPIGIIGYQQNEPTGWCSIAPRETYTRLEKSTTLKRLDDLPVWSVTCFFVLRKARGHDFSQTLLRAAVDYAKSQGAQVVEGYPVELHHDQDGQLRGQGISYAFMGDVAAFEKVGFTTAFITLKGRRIMRFYLTPGEMKY